MILNFPIKQRRFILAHAGNGWTRFPLPLRRSVHPRACGERQNQGRHTGADAGSSPRMRGTVWRCVWHDPVSTVHPRACGNGLEHSRTKLALTVHPRACGERAAPRVGVVQGAGSSPRMRGTVQTGSASPAWCRPYPRACGERREILWLIRVVNGLSPRMRGTAGSCGTPRADRRFIPAHAGNGPTRHERYGPIPVHPRACGNGPGFERLYSARRFISAHAGNGRGGVLRLLPSAGSSPRMRGTVNQTMGQYESSTVHPRACGERASSRPPIGIPRFIPAHAGNGGRSAPPLACRPVHPRACGERWSRSKSNCRSGGSSRACGERTLAGRTSRPGPPSGSSPRMRGTAVRAGHLHWSVRFIPAHAGNGQRTTERIRAVAGSSPRMRGTAILQPVRRHALVSSCGERV